MFIFYCTFVISLLLPHYITCVTFCHVEGIDDLQWITSYDNAKILDTYNGTVATFTTIDVQSVHIEEGKYLDVSLTGNVLTIFTTADYLNIENELPSSSFPDFFVRIGFQCTFGNETLTFVQPIEDVNNHSPVFDQTLYVYGFGMNIAANLILTDFVPISGTDIDLTSSGVEFSIEPNEYLTIEYYGSSSDKTSLAKLTTLTNITVPFSRNFTITVKDRDIPFQTTTSTVYLLLRTVNDFVPNPAFSKSLYVANYNKVEHQLKIHEPIALKSGAGYNNVVQQRGLEEYFETINIDGVLSVNLIQHLPDNILSSTDFVIIDFEVKNEGALHPGKASLMIYLNRM